MVMTLPMASNLPPSFKQCGDCQKCCEGWVGGEAFGVSFHPHKPCVFLQKKCLVYSFRPDVCKKFYCAWVQGIFPDWMRPDLTNVLISVNDWSKGQFLKVIACDQPVSENVMDEIRKFSQSNKCPYMVHYNGRTDLFGTQEFVDEFMKPI